MSAVDDPVRRVSALDEASRPRLLVHDYVGHPLQLQLSREFARRGVDVLHLHCGSFRTGKGAVDDAGSEHLRIEEINLKQEFSRYSPWRRLLQEREYGLRLCERARAFAPDIVISANTPLLSQRYLLHESRRLGSRFVFWQQDMIGIGVRKVLERQYGPLGAVIGRGFMALERSLLQASDAVVAISAGFLPALEKLGIRTDNVYVIENWGPLDELPLRPRANAWARAHGLVDKRVILYSGTLGLKHNPGVILQLAHDMSGYPDVEVVVVSEGKGADWLRQRRDAERLGNLRLLPFQPYSALPDVLASGDILLTLLEADAGAFSVPSKVLSYLCAGRPLVAAVPNDNLAAEVVRRSGGGILVEPSDTAEVFAKAFRLLADSTLRRDLGGQARRYAEGHFEIRAIADRFAPVLQPNGSFGLAAVAKNGSNGAGFSG